MTFGPSDRWYEPLEPPGPCCALAEDEDDHDTEACLAASAEAAAERAADRAYEQAQWRGWDE